MLSAGADTCAGVIITELTGCSCRTFRIYLAAVNRNVYGSFIVIAAVIAGSDTRAAARAAFCRDLTAVDNDGAGLFMLAAADARGSFTAGRVYLAAVDGDTAAAAVVAAADTCGAVKFIFFAFVVVIAAFCRYVACRFAGRRRRYPRSFCHRSR